MRKGLHAHHSSKKEREAFLHPLKINENISPYTVVRGKLSAYLLLNEEIIL
jgi:hypothetical protein